MYSNKLYDNNQSENIEILKLYEQMQYLKIPSTLESFVNTETIIDNKYGKEYYVFKGYLLLNNDEEICDKCHCMMHINDKYDITLKHIPIGGTYTSIVINIKQLFCPKCKVTKMQRIPIKVDKHLITNQLKTYI